eukprot:4991918-Pleurochrysis_carterae.AAC.1
MSGYTIANVDKRAWSSDELTLKPSAAEPVLSDAGSDGSSAHSFVCAASPEGAEAEESADKQQALLSREASTEGRALVRQHGARGIISAAWEVAAGGGGHAQCFSATLDAAKFSIDFGAAAAWGAPAAANELDQIMQV